MAPFKRTKSLLSLNLGCNPGVIKPLKQFWKQQIPFKKHADAYILKIHKNDCILDTEKQKNLIDAEMVQVQFIKRQKQYMCM